MSNLELYWMGWKQIILNFWPVFIFFIASVIKLWRWERHEKKRLEEAVKRDNLKRINSKKHSA